MKLSPRDFKKFFSTPFRVKCFNASFLLRSSVAKADVFLTGNNERFDIYIRKSKEKICGREGLKIYGNKNKFAKYLKDFKNIINDANKNIVPKYSNPIAHMTQKDFQEAFNCIQKFWFLYGMAEFPYMDTAYKIATKMGNKDMIKNLEKAGWFKYKARNLMNTFFFKKGVIENLVRYVSKNIMRSKNDADYLFIEELLKTFDGWKPDKKMISERRECYGAVAINGKITIFPYKKALALNKKFTKYKNISIIKGMCASPGKAGGRAIISPMLDDHKAIARINKKMKKGDILIAETTSPDTIMLCNKARAIVAEQSGLLSHAAIVSRERKIPCIIQAINSTRIIEDGDLVEVDANKGVVKVLKKA